MILEQPSCPHMLCKGTAHHVIRVAISCILLMIIDLCSMYAQSVKKPIPAQDQRCRDLNCLDLRPEVKALDLRKRYERGQVPDKKHLDQMEWLNLSKNKLGQLPDWVCDCKNLKVLDVSSNRLSRLPDCLSGLHSLRYLSVNRNPLPFLPNAMAYLDSLETLDLWQTWIDAFDPGFSRWRDNLKVLDLRDIRMTREQQQEIRALFVETEILFAAPCNCRPHRKK